jgi:hypothetical protein
MEDNMNNTHMNQYNELLNSPAMQADCAGLLYYIELDEPYTIDSRTELRVADSRRDGLRKADQ